MAIEIRVLAKPEIYLIGNSVSGGNQITGEIFSGIVDHSKNGTTTILSTTSLNKEDILTFNGSVRIIITGQLTPKPNYNRKSGTFTNLEYEGKVRYNNLDISHYAETYYTLNGKDPVRTANYLYNYTDRDDYVEEDKTETMLPSINPSTGEVNPSAPVSISTDNNLNTLGFILRNVNSGNNVITLKARTFFQGRISPVAVAYFKIYNSTIYTTIIDNTNNNS